MPRNQKLTKLIAGRTVKAATVEPGAVLVVFDDQSKMKIKTAGPATIPPGGKVKSVHEAKTEFKIDFDGPTRRFPIYRSQSRSAKQQLRCLKFFTPKNRARII